MPLGNTKLRMTRQRRFILEELRAVYTHPSAEEVYAMVRRRLPHISLSTVYRNLETLTEEGIVQKLATGNSQARFDGEIMPHGHMTCVKCGSIKDIQGSIAVDFGETLQDTQGFKVIDYQVVVRGTCGPCQNGNSNVN